MGEYISGEEHMQTVSTRRSKPNYAKPFLATAAAVLLLSGGFVGGMSYQKSRPGSAATTATTAAFGVGGGMNGPQTRVFQGERPTIGVVAAVADGSFTVKDDQSGETSQFAISSDTQFMNAGAAAVASDMHTGDTVLVIVDSEDKTKAVRVDLNPPVTRMPEAGTSSSIESQ